MNSSNNIEDMVDLKNNILNGLFEKQMFRSTNCKTNAAIYMKELNSKINKRYFPDKPKNLAKKLYKSLGSR